MTAALLRIEGTRADCPVCGLDVSVVLAETHCIETAKCHHLISVEIERGKVFLLFAEDEPK